MPFLTVLWTKRQIVITKRKQIVLWHFICDKTYKKYGNKY